MCNQLTGVPNCHRTPSAQFSGWWWSVLPSHPPWNSLQLLLSPRQTPESWCADRSCDGRQGHTAHTDFGSWAASTQQQQLFHIIGFKWYLWVEVLGVTSWSPLETVGELLGHNAQGAHRAGGQVCCSVLGPHMDRYGTSVYRITA